MSDPANGVPTGPTAGPVADLTADGTDVAPAITRVAVIGPGRVGTALAMALPPDRYLVQAVAGRSLDDGASGGASGNAAAGGSPEASPAIERFLRLVPGAVPMASADAVRDAGLVLVCVPDDTLADVARDLAASDAVRPGSRWLHTAGGHGLEPLRPIRLAGAGVAACHPAQTFPDPETGRASLPGAAWAVTAEPRDLPWAEQVVRDLGGVPVRVADADRVRYHAGLVIGANGASSVVAQARELLLSTGIADPELFLASLVPAAVRNAAAQGAAALTGPVRRGDAGTVRRHLAELDATLPEAAEAYRALARLALRQARRAGLDERAAARVAAELEHRGAAEPDHDATELDARASALPDPTASQEEST